MLAPTPHFPGVGASFFFQARATEPMQSALFRAGCKIGFDRRLTPRLRPVGDSRGSPRTGLGHLVSSRHRSPDAARTVLSFAGGPSGRRGAFPRRHRWTINQAIYRKLSSMNLTSQQRPIITVASGSVDRATNSTGPDQAQTATGTGVHHDKYR